MTGSSPQGPLASVEPAQFRDALARWASGVTIITADSPEGRAGMTAASFSSLSLDPPLVLVCIARSAYAHSALTEAEGFGAHILGRQQQDLSNTFARGGADKYADIADERGAFGVPLLPLGVARLVCARHAVLDGGDHSILVGRVVEVALGEQEPLVYCDRDYHGLT